MSEQLYLLPVWPTEKRVTPNVFARGSLFGVDSNRKKREHFESRVLASIYNKTVDSKSELVRQDKDLVTYSGIELRQDDADLFFQLII